MAMMHIRDERTIDITPSWWHPRLTWGTPVEQWCHKARCVVNGIDVFARSKEGAEFVGLFADLSTNVHGATVRMLVPQNMTDEDVERMRAALVESFNASPPYGVVCANMAA